MTEASPARDPRSELESGTPVLLDGATGTELERRGAACALPLWSAAALIEAPDLLARIHADYVAAGVDYLTANTFRTQERSLARGGLAGRARELTLRAVEIARGAAQAAGGRGVGVLGSAPTLEDCYRPDLVPDAASLDREHTAHARHLAEAGVDAILVETMNSVREAVAAVRAARATQLPVLVSFVCDAEARLLSGEPLARAVSLLAQEGPLATLVNCLPPDHVAACLPALRSAECFGVYANLGAPGANAAPPSHSCTPAAFAGYVVDWVAAGARIVGGCCGTEPAHLLASAQALRN